jgi:CheY-like chemotaxis protein
MVEDDDVDREMIHRVLNQLQRPIEVFEAGSCSEAKAMLAKATFDCVFLDYHLGDAKLGSRSGQVSLHARRSDKRRVVLIN